MTWIITERSEVQAGPDRQNVEVRLVAPVVHLPGVLRLERGDLREARVGGRDVERLLEEMRVREGDVHVTETDGEATVGADPLHRPETEVVEPVARAAGLEARPEPHRGQAGHDVV